MKKHHRFMSNMTGMALTASAFLPIGGVAPVPATRGAKKDLWYSPTQKFMDVRVYQGQEVRFSSWTH